MKILGRTQMIPAATYEEAVRQIMNLGFDGVEIGIMNRDFQICDEFFADEFSEKMKSCLKQSGEKFVLKT